MQRKILNGIYYEAYDKFKKAIHSFFQHIDHYRTEPACLIMHSPFIYLRAGRLKSLITLNPACLFGRFQIIDWKQPVNLSTLTVTAGRFITSWGYLNFRTLKKSFRRPRFNIVYSFFIS